MEKAFDFNVLMKSIQTSFEKKFEGISVSTEYPENQSFRSGESSRPGKSIFVTCTELMPHAEDQGTGQESVAAQFDFRIFVQTKGNPLARIEALEIAATASQFVRNQTWGAPDEIKDKIYPAEFLMAADDHFDFDVETTEVWRVAWEQVIKLGDNAWDDESFYLENAALRGDEI